jgi:catechol 2,3-dioxygenase-like lactoylglutathione lyase family enzyme
MLSDARLLAFVATTDPARARVFYEEVLGLTFVADEPFALVFQSNTVGLRIAKVAALTLAPYTVLGWVVVDIAATARALGERGVVFERFPGFSQDAQGVASFPDGTRVAWFKDPDGNMLSLTQFA